MSRGPRYWLRRAAVVLLVLGVGGAAVAAVSAEMRATRDETAEVSGIALATRVERIRLGSVLASTATELESTRNERTIRHAERVEGERRLETLYARLLGVNEELAELVASSELHVLNLDATKQCLFGVRRAVEQAAVDDTRGSLASLDAVAPACARAQAAGERS